MRLDSSPVRVVHRPSSAQPLSTPSVTSPSNRDLQENSATNISSPKSPSANSFSRESARETISSSHSSYSSSLSSHSSSSSSSSSCSSEESSSRLYKFKSNMKQRFTVDSKHSSPPNASSPPNSASKRPQKDFAHYDDNSRDYDHNDCRHSSGSPADSAKFCPKPKRPRMSNESTSDSEKCNGISEPKCCTPVDQKGQPPGTIDGMKQVDREAVHSPCKERQGSPVPIFAFNQSGSFYVPMAVDPSVVSSALMTKSDLAPVLHPISIYVNFSPPCIGSSIAMAPLESPMLTSIGYQRQSYEGFRTNRESNDIASQSKHSVKTEMSKDSSRLPSYCNSPSACVRSDSKYYPDKRSNPQSLPTKNDPPGYSKFRSSPEKEIRNTPIVRTEKVNQPSLNLENSERPVPHESSSSKPVPYENHSAQSFTARETTPSRALPQERTAATAQNSMEARQSEAPRTLSNGHFQVPRQIPPMTTVGYPSMNFSSSGSRTNSNSFHQSSNNYHSGSFIPPSNGHLTSAPLNHGEVSSRNALALSAGYPDAMIAGAHHHGYHPHLSGQFPHHSGPSHENISQPSSRMSRTVRNANDGHCSVPASTAASSYYEGCPPTGAGYPGYHRTSSVLPWPYHVPARPFKA